MQTTFLQILKSLSYLFFQQRFTHKHRVALMKTILFIGFILSTHIAISQNKSPNLNNFDFENISINPWKTIGNEALLSESIKYSGKHALELKPGTIAKTTIEVNPLSRYKLTGWLKTESGSGEVRLGVKGLEEHNAGVASALTAWTQVEVIFVTGTGQSQATVEIENPANGTSNRAWADDLAIKYMGTYTPKKNSGIKILTQRIPISDMGIAQQSNTKMNWLLDAKFGMFIHWGLFAGPAKGEWFMENNGWLPEKYRTLAYPESEDQYFAADKFNADDWAKLAEDAGMKYMSMVTMHHDGYALFESKAYNAFTSKQTLNRDFVKEYVDACHQHNLKVGLYKTLINWRYPGYYDVTGTDCKPNKFGYTTDASHKENARLMKDELYCQVKELMTNYGKIDIIFWDGGWLGQQGSDADGAYFWESGKYIDPSNEWSVNSYFQDKDSTGKALGLMGIVRKYQPDVIVNPRCGWYGDFKSEEGGQPITGPVRSEEVWEKCMTISSGWGYTPAHADSTKVLRLGDIKRMLADCVIRNMVFLLNVGPDRHGEITPATQNVLRQTGNWLKQVGKAVYGTRGGPWNPVDGTYGFAYKDKTIYLYLLKDFKSSSFTFPALNPDQHIKKVYSVSDGQSIKFKKIKRDETLLYNIPIVDKDVTIIAIELNKPVIPSQTSNQ